MQKIAIIIPCYNEAKRLKEKNIVSLINDTNVKLYFANDGSKDDTINILEKLKKISPERIDVIDFKENQGKANTIYKAINLVLKEEKYDYLGYLDADFSTSPKEFIRIIDDLEKHKYALIFGSRVKLLNSKINRKWQRHIIGRIIITLINFKFKLGVYDTQCGAKIFSTEMIKEAFDKPFYTSWLFDVEVFIRLKQKNILQKAKEFPLNEWKDVEGSKLGWRSAFKIFKELIVLFGKY